MSSTTNSMKTVKIIFIISLMLLLLCAYFLSYNYLFRPYYSWRYDENISKMVFNHGEKLRGTKSDSIFIIDYDYLECGFDPRIFIDKRLTRANINAKAQNAGLKYIKYVSREEQLSYLSVMEFPYLFKKQACYRLNIWTDTYGLWPNYHCEIIETYYNKDTLSCFKYNLEYSLFGLSKIDSSFTKQYSPRASSVDGK